MRILLAEDRAMVAEAIADQLCTRGHDVTIAPTAVPLLRAAADADLDLDLLIVMPR